MRLFSVPVLLLSAIPWTLSAAVDPGLLDLVPPDAKILSGVQVDRALQSSFGQFALARFQQNDGMAQFIAATGFDFRRDLHEVLVAGNGIMGPASAENVILVRGRFQPTKIASLAALSGATSSSYSGIPILTSPSGPQQMSGAFIDVDTLVLGTIDAIKNSIDRRASSAHFSGALAQKAIGVSGTYDVWIATIDPLTSFNLPNMNGVPMTAFSSIIEVSAGIRFETSGANVTGEALTRSGQDAQAIAGMGQLLLAIAQSTKTQSSQAGAALLQGATISADGNKVQITLSVPEQQLEQMFQPPAGAKKVSLPVR